MNNTTTYLTKEDDGTKTTVMVTKQAGSTVVETSAEVENKTMPITRKTKKPVDLKAAPRQTEDTPKTKKRYFYEKTGNYVSYARAKQLGLVS